jgi:hypothetical protein
VACVLNGLGQPAPAETRLSRGMLPLRAAAGEPLDRRAPARLDQAPTFGRKTFKPFAVSWSHTSCSQLLRVQTAYHSSLGKASPPLVCGAAANQ